MIHFRRLKRFGEAVTNEGEGAQPQRLIIGADQYHYSEELKSLILSKSLSSSRLFITRGYELIHGSVSFSEKSKYLIMK